MTHSWGDGPSLLTARGPQIEARIPGGSAVDVDYERFTGLPRMSNIPVDVRPLARPS
ncbi:MAG: hypothetical protein R3E53_10980 [Myxococcota bacterium]